MDTLLAGQNEILEKIAAGASLPEILTALVDLIESQTKDMLGSICLLDEDGIHIRHGAAPSLPESYVKAIDGSPIGPTAGSCGTAAYFGKPVIVTDINKDPLWNDYRELAAKYGFLACWSTPILSHTGKVLGTFAMYYRVARAPGVEEQRLTKIATHIASIAIENGRIEESLRRSEERYRALVTASSQHVWRTDDKGDAFFVTKGWAEMTGQSEQESSGFGWLKAVHPEDRERCITAWQKAKLDRGWYKNEFRVRVRSGEYRTLQCCGVPIFKWDGSIREWVGANTDVTEIKRAEQSLRESEERSRAILRAIPDSMFLISSDFTYLDCQVRASCHSPIPSEQLIGKNMRDVLPPQLAERFACSFQKASETRQAQFVEYERPVNGQAHYFEGQIIPTSDGKFLALVRDITERRRAEQALRASEERFRLVAMATRDGVYDCDLRTQVAWRNEPYQSLFSAGEPIENTFTWWEERIHPNDRSRVTKSFQDACQSQTPFWSDEYSLRRLDGNHAIVLDRCYILYDDAGQPVRIIGAVTDITERRLAEEALRERERELSQSNAKIRELAGKIMTAQEEERRRISRELHDDLNQKVAALSITISTILYQLPVAEPLRAQLEMLHRYSIGIADGIHRLSHDLHPPVLEHVGLAAALKAYVSEFCRLEKIQVALTVPNAVETIPQDAAVCLYRVAQESLRNIVKHSGAATAEMTLSVDDQAVRLNVTDSGLGFDLISARNNGGLGLASMEERVRLMQGSFRISSEPGGGSKLLATIPLRKHA
jgi:PAS domain S-box-containing protein